MMPDLHVAINGGASLEGQVDSTLGRKTCKASKIESRDALSNGFHY